MKCYQITSNLWLGPCPQDAADMRYLKALGITAILSLQSQADLGQREVGWPESAAQAEGLDFNNVPVTDFDSLDLAWKLPRCVKVLDELLRAGNTVYLHCTAGVSRSPTVAAAYLHWCLKSTLDEALTRVKQVPQTCPLGDVIRRAHWPTAK
jgi:protein-tyrosine phosphatase